ncbi:hypothetical protein HYT25_03555 [Candidatus Pacearchaeota archaeon]|nr:hypothetical protein [Candidatus Pacearchaeota archaeon]
MVNFKKISAITGSALMVGMTMGVAAAANYPAPFVSGGAANVAIVYGTGSGVSILDAVEAGSIQANLQTYMSGTGSTTGSVTGEAAALFTGGTKLYINDSLNTVRSVLTKNELPTILASTSFSGDVDATLTQTIDIGSNPRVTFKKQPTGDDEPQYALTLSTSQANYIYNATATFSKAVNFSHADSEGQSLSLFGMPVTIGSATDTDTIVLLKSAEKLDLSSDAPTASVTIAGATYTIELVSASDTAATVKVTDSTGKSESKEINEAASKKVNGISMAVVTADETNLKLSASIIAGSDKITLEDGSAVKIGEADTSIDGTLVDFETGNPNNLTSLTISVYASESDKDAIKVGESFLDPVFGSFKLDFSGLNIATDSTARETITVTPNTDDKMEVTFTDHRGYEKTFQWSKDIAGNLLADYTSSALLMVDDNNRNMTVVEMGNISYNDYVVVGNEEKGYLLRLTGLKNASNTGSSNTEGDRVEFTDVFSGELHKTLWTSDGVGYINTIGGQRYDVYLTGNASWSTSGSTGEEWNWQVKLDYPDSTGNGVVILFPTIKTSKGAKIAFYEPTELRLSGHGVAPGRESQVNITEIKIPDGDGYESATIAVQGDGNLDNSSAFTITVDGAANRLVVNGTPAGVLWDVGGLRFNITNLNGTTGLEDGSNKTMIYLTEPDGIGNINTSALIVWEEKDDNSDYHAQIIVLESGRTSDDGLGVDTGLSGDTWSNASSSWRSSRASNSKITDAGDLWGTILTLDSGDSDQPKATISYPDEQIYPQLYIAANDATITAGTVAGATGAAIGDVLVKDSEVSSVSTKNLVVVGGSCINSVAANLVDAGCGSGWTDKTGVGSGQFLIQSFGDAYSTGKIALLVAGYEVSDTVNAAKYLRTQTVMTDAGKKYIGTSSTSATLQTEETTA